MKIILVAILLAAWSGAIVGGPKKGRRVTKPKEPLDEEKMRSYSVADWAEFPKIILDLYANRLNLLQGTSREMAETLFRHYHPDNIDETPTGIEEANDDIELTIERPSRKGKRKIGSGKSRRRQASRWTAKIQQSPSTTRQTPREI